jgi:hypothetical protein
LLSFLVAGCWLPVVEGAGGGFVDCRVARVAGQMRPGSR